MTLTVGSLFSGIGGLDLGLERAGMNVIWQSEIDPYGCQVLKKHWPEVVNHGNIKEINWGDVVRPDIICGGYPCQPFSTAGKRNGTDDPRHLWPWVREAISELRPKYAILENVRGHVSLGLNVVLGEMASIGYDAEWQIVSAASVGAPHRRDRVIIVAYPREQLEHGRGHLNSQSALGQGQAVQEPVSGSDSPSANTIGQLANPNSLGHLRRQPQIFTTERWLNALSLIGSCSTDVANADSISGHQQHQRQVQQLDTVGRSEIVADPDNAGSGTPTGGIDGNGTQEIQEWGDKPQSGLSGCSEVMADTNSSDTPNGRERQGIQSQDTSWRDDRSGSGSDIGQVSMGSTGEDSSDMANTNARETSRRLRGVSTDTGQIREQRNYARREESHAGRQWWATEPDVGRVAHGIPSRVDRLRGLGNAVVPQVAELIGRMVIDYDTNL
jgi:DNA-cytosine methyltransferase